MFVQKPHYIDDNGVPHYQTKKEREFRLTERWTCQLLTNDRTTNEPAKHAQLFNLCPY